MALNAAPVLVYCANGSKTSAYSQPAIPVLPGGRPNFSNSRIQRDFECLCQRAVAPVEDDESPSARYAAQRPALIAQRDLNSLPSE